MPLHLPTDPPIVEVPAEAVLWRVHSRARSPLWFGPGSGNPPRYRYDAPGGEYGACYFGSTLGVSIIETLVRGRRTPIISRGDLESWSATAFSPLVNLRVLQLEGEGLPAFAISAHEISGPEYAACQDLALRAWRDHPDVDAIQYRSRWENSVCWAVFDRAAAKLTEMGTQWLGDPAVVVPALRPYKHVAVI